MKRACDFTVEINKRQKIDKENTYHNGSEPSDLTNMLSHDDLLELFSWLPIDDLVTVRRVCHSWRVTAQDDYLWKDHVLTVYPGPRYERRVKLMPNIKNLKGFAHISLLDVILENVCKLRKLNVEFYPRISSSQVALVLEKYPEIESVTLGSCKPDILECLKVLKTSKHLKEVIFTNICCNNLPCSSASEIMDIFTGHENFPALTAIDLSSDTHFESSLHSDTFRNIVTGIISNKCQQFLSLRIYLGPSECVEILDAISSCVKLQNLHLAVSFVNAKINIDSMTELRSLYLKAFKADRNFASSVKNSLERGSWLHLAEVDINLYFKYEYNVDILRAVIDNCKQLKKLKYEDISYKTSEDQLECISSLTALESFDVHGLQNISEKGVTCISKCKKLKKLMFFPYKSYVSDHHSCIKDILLQLRYLHYFHVRDINENIYLLLTDREEIDRYISH